MTPADPRAAAIELVLKYKREFKSVIFCDYCDGLWDHHDKDCLIAAISALLALPVAETGWQRTQVLREVLDEMERINEKCQGAGECWAALSDWLYEETGRHKRSCPVYGNYQPPYEDCNCGAAPPEPPEGA